MTKSWQFKLQNPCKAALSHAEKGLKKKRPAFTLEWKDGKPVKLLATKKDLLIEWY